MNCRERDGAPEGVFDFPAGCFKRRPTRKDISLARAGHGDALYGEKELPRPRLWKSIPELVKRKEQEGQQA